MNFKVWLPVQIATGRVDYEPLSQIHVTKPESPRYDLVPEWEWREFAVVDLSKGLGGIIDEL